MFDGFNLYPELFVRHDIWWIIPQLEGTFSKVEINAVTIYICMENYNREENYMEKLLWNYTEKQPRNFACDPWVLLSNRCKYA